MASGATETVEAVFRIESGRIVAGVARIVWDEGIAEELAQDSLVAALAAWPASGVPRNPSAWLMATAKHRAIDLVRRKETYARKLAEVGRALDDLPPPEPADADDIDDDLLRLIFTACHPVLSPEARIALTLRLVGGLTTEEIARAFLASEPTVAQGIVRAKRTLARAEGPFEVPTGSIGRPASRRCSRSSTSCSTRATPPLLATTWCARHSARPGSAWFASWQGSCPRSPRSTAWPLSWSSRPLASRHAPDPTASRCCSRTRTAPDGTGC